jgi:hypothetical protein
MTLDTLETMLSNMEANEAGVDACAAGCRANLILRNE